MMREWIFHGERVYLGFNLNICKDCPCPKCDDVNCKLNTCELCHNGGFVRITDKTNAPSYCPIYERKD